MGSRSSVAIVKHVSLAGLFLLLMAPRAFAESEGAPPAPCAKEKEKGKTPLTNGNSFARGDRLKLNMFLSGFTEEGSAKKTYFAPPGSVLKIISAPDSDKTLSVYFTADGCEDKGYLYDSTCWNRLHFDTRNKAYITQHPSDNLIELQREYKIETSAITDSSYSTKGVDYGALVAPYKFHLKDHRPTGGAVVGGYAGYKFSFMPIDVTPILSAGFGVVPLDAEGDSESKDVAALNAAVGFKIDLKRNGAFQVGVLLGWDWAGKGNKYKYEGEPWLAISFGTDLSKK